MQKISVTASRLEQLCEYVKEIINENYPINKGDLITKLISRCYDEGTFLLPEETNITLRHAIDSKQITELDWTYHNNTLHNKPLYFPAKTEFFVT